MGNKYTEKDAAEETDSSNSEVREAWHTAREDAQQSDHPVDKALTEGWTREPDTPIESSDDTSSEDTSSEDTSSDESE